MSRLNFNLEAVASGSRARAATFRTLHNEVKTPLFMPVGTNATVRGQRVETLHDCGSQILLANTYHLLLRPGPEVFKKVGGIHPFMNWGKSVLTDSGGFQIFSLPHSRKMTEEGAAFQSYVDGDRILLSPEKSIQTQLAIGSDIMMVLDQCVPSTSEHAVAEEAMHLTHRWAKRSLEARGGSPQSMFAIVQGACIPELRKQSADFLTQMPFDGFAIGGLAVGETKELREDFTELTAELLPRNLPRYLMGVGTPIDLLEAVHRGVDMFDCILPTALAQQGVVFTSQGRLELRRGVYKYADEKLDPACPCPTCAGFSRAYLHHLVKVREVMGWQLIGTHNLYFYHRLMAEMRQHILQDTFAAFYREKRQQLVLSDQENPKTFPKRSKPNKKPPTTLGAYEITQHAEGFSSIRQISSGEVMHSVNDPVAEAQRLYIDQSRLAERLASDTRSPLIIWDVGLGAATNAMAAIRCYEKQAALLPEQDRIRPMELISFENDLDSLRLALLNPWQFQYLRHQAPFLLLEAGSWHHPTLPLKWTLKQGDFLENLNQVSVPEVIFYDPFSSKTDSALWTLECFSKIAEHCRSRAVELFTYSASTAVRSALLGAGFFVAKGVGTGPKPETTIAINTRPLTDRHSVLGADWLSKWERSGARFPQGTPDSDLSRFEDLIRNHPQFRND